jgi:hypothetical protein
MGVKGRSVGGQILMHEGDEGYNNEEAYNTEDEDLLPSLYRFYHLEV